MNLRRGTTLYVCFVLLGGLHVGGLPSADAQTARPTFEVATVKRAVQADQNSGFWSPPNTGRFTASHVSLARLMQLAYGVNASQIANPPTWFESNLYDVEAKPEGGIRLSREELKPRLQALLEQRFGLVAHWETRNAHAYALVIGKGGTHLSPTKGEKFSGYRISVRPGQMRGLNWSMPILANYLGSVSEFAVVDQTGLAGSYDIDFTYDPNPTAESTLPSLEVALKESTGLVLKPQLVPVETIVIDSVSAVPSEN